MAQDKTRFQSALSSWPAMEVDGDTVKLSGGYERAGAGHRVLMAFYAVATCWVVAFVVFVAATDGRLPKSYFQWSIGIAVVIWIVAAIAASRGKIDIAFSPGKMTVNGAAYRLMPGIQFSVEPHHLGARIPSYRPGAEVIMQYGERRVILAELGEGEKEKARSLILRLQSVFKMIDEGAEQAAAPPSQPADEFRPARPLR